MKKRGIQNEDEKLAKEFEREEKKARAKAGRKIGGKLKKAQRRKLKASGASQRRIDAVRYVVGKKDPTLIWLDHAPLAEAQEEGKTIRPTDADYLAVGFMGVEENNRNSDYKEDEGIRIGKDPDKKYLVRKTASGDLELLATLLKEIRIKKSLGHRETAEKYLEDYVDAIDENLNMGEGNGRN